jgi:tRNA threonylcarbamoyladenosine modification (KEOPS) complex  Pcc1 subunit
MAKIEFDDQSSVEVKKSADSNKVIICITAKDAANALKKIVNSVEISQEQWNALIADIK